MPDPQIDDFDAIAAEIAFAPDAGPGAGLIPTSPLATGETFHVVAHPDRDAWVVLRLVEPPQGAKPRRAAWIEAPHDAFRGDRPGVFLQRMVDDLRAIIRGIDPRAEPTDA